MGRLLVAPGVERVDGDHLVWPQRRRQLLLQSRHLLQMRLLPRVRNLLLLLPIHVDVVDVRPIEGRLLDGRLHGRLLDGRLVLLPERVSAACCLGEGRPSGLEAARHVLCCGLLRAVVW